LVKKKVAVKSLEMRREMVCKHPKISMTRQCELLSIYRSGVYYKPVPESDENLEIMRMLDEQYLKTPFYGIRRLTRWLKKQGKIVNSKRVKRLMGVIGWQTLYRRPNTSWKNKSHKVYPYLLKGLKIERKNQVWAVDITYVPMRRGFMYLFAVIDLHTRYVVNWSISNTMTSEWCASVIEEAIANHGQPEIINSDQGSQFTSFEYISLLTDRQNPIKVSMDGKGRAIDNIFIERLWKSVKYECIYLHAFEDGVQLYKGLDEYFTFYNCNRGHQSLEYKTPEEVYKNAA
jgi:putative transposase